jgi:hypothetical protein
MATVWGRSQKKEKEMEMKSKKLMVLAGMLLLLTSGVSYAGKNNVVSCIRKICKMDCKVIKGKKVCVSKCFNATDSCIIKK